MPVSHLFGAKLTGEKFHRWRHDNWPMGEWVILDATPDIAYVNHFFSSEFVIWFKSIHISGETSRRRTLDGCATSLKLTSLDFRNFWEVDL